MGDVARKRKRGGQREKVSEVCSRPPGLQDESAPEQKKPLPASQGFLAPRPRDARTKSAARDVEAKTRVDEALDFYVKTAGEDGIQKRQALGNMRPGELRRFRERWQVCAEDVQRLQHKKTQAWEFFRRQGGQRWRREKRRSSTVGHNNESDENLLQETHLACNTRIWLSNWVRGLSSATGNCWREPCDITYGFILKSGPLAKFRYCWPEPSRLCEPECCENIMQRKHSQELSVRDRILEEVARNHQNQGQ